MGDAMTDAEFAAKRLRMVDSQLRTNGVTDAAVLSAMGEVPREAFVPAARRPLAYIDEDLEISVAGPPRFLMAPAPFARMVQLAAVRPTDRVLDVGCGSGYSSAVLARLAASVVALECDADLAARARAALSALGIGSVEVVEGALERGFPQRGPFDVIVVAGAADEIPEALRDQLAENGRLVAVVGRGNAATVQLGLRQDGLLSFRRGFNAAAMPLPGFRREPAFEF